MRTPVVLIALLLLQGAASAETRSDECRRIRDPLQRSDCFNRIPLEVLQQENDPGGAAPAMATSAPVGRTWSVSNSIDKLDGTRTTSAVLTTLRATIYPHRRTPEQNVLAAFSIQCSDGKAMATIFLPNQLVAGHVTPTSYRIDQRKPVRGRWIASEDSTGVGRWDHKQAVALTKELAGGSEMFVRIEHNVFGTTEATFDISRSQEALSQLPCLAAKGR